MSAPVSARVAAARIQDGYKPYRRQLAREITLTCLGVFSLFAAISIAILMGMVAS